jgi:probable phosphoglycerate mutase
MKLLIVRHADPDYENDSLTEIGWIEAELLSERMQKLDVKAFYVSPLGRAKATAGVTLQAMNREAQECKWLREFSAPTKKPNETKPGIPWDWLPADWTGVPDAYDPDRWMDSELFRNSRVAEEYRWVTGELDKLIASHGYVREGNFYRAVEPNEDTIVLVCHFGLECVLLSHLLHVSPMVLWHGTCAAPTSVTTVVTEERREGIASFRVAAFGDTSHLYAAGREPSFSGRFRETYTNETQRRD